MYSNKHLHIISHMVPWPANFGGVIDIYHSIIALHQCGIKIHLHCFTEDSFPTHSPLSAYCEKIFYYSRKTGFAGLSVTKPYISYSRRNSLLLKRLQKDTYPILAQGIHCSQLLLHPSLKERKKSLRLFNVEALYYRTLANLEKDFLKKWYYKIEANRLATQEKLVADAVQIITLSNIDEEYYRDVYKAKTTAFVPVFTAHNDLRNFSGLGEYCLYQGNLSVNENEAMVQWLVQNVFQDLKIPFVIAGKSPSASLQKIVASFDHVKLIANPSAEKMGQLIKDAQVHIIPSMNRTGVKLKLLEVLFSGRHCITNAAGVAGSGLENLCHIGESGDDFQILIQNLFGQVFTQENSFKRKLVLDAIYDNRKNALLIGDLVL